MIKYIITTRYRYPSSVSSSSRNQRLFNDSDQVSSPILKISKHRLSRVCEPRILSAIAYLCCVLLHQSPASSFILIESGQFRAGPNARLGLSARLSPSLTANIWVYIQLAANCCFSQDKLGSAKSDSRLPTRDLENRIPKIS